MKATLKKITFTITKTETMEIVICTDNGFDMPKTIGEIIELNNDINGSPLRYIYDTKTWNIDDIAISAISYE